MNMDKRNKTVAALLALFLGSLGVHAFYIGNVKMGVIMLLLTLTGICTAGISSGIVHVVAIVQGILYLVASDSEFHRKYVVNKKLF